eukprot:1600327-Heterocapsa_arctica.AAC.1
MPEIDLSPSGSLRRESGRFDGYPSDLFGHFLSRTGRQGPSFCPPHSCRCLFYALLPAGLPMFSR